MTDPRHTRLAQVLVHYCVELKPRQLLQIQSTYQAEPLLKEIYREAVQAGAYIITRIGLDGLAPIFYRHATDDQIAHISEVERFEIEKIDAFINVWANWNTKQMTGVDPKKLALSSSSRKDIFQRFLERAQKGELKWVGTQYPTNASAQDAEMSLGEYEDFVFGAMLLDKPDPIAEWRKVSAAQERIVGVLNQAKNVAIKGKDTNLRFRCEGRKWVNCDGKENFPDGEVFTGPIEDSVEGTIRFTFPAIYQGREVEDVRLRFEKGRVVEAHANKGEDLLTATLDSDAGARFVGEIAIGTNYGIQRFTRNTLFDEKIGGTVHLAVGASLPESGGKNESAIHWDMVCDLRPGGEITADGKVIHREGKFVI